ncbi:shikimate 5-dehydrogenase [Longilinea arvoryzae]|uniref:Shikimate 5-dehydrogenase n=1 Tax=Longilinea arvoryzae TaxID=360412 RepID=A0A0S7BH43_9CHLR|nr:shikimate dehydrogenase [Longilinea arvoryzae]GAP13153.1 shikimate 5-dehydrogenase [Longilinea arvoryzae]
MQKQYPVVKKTVPTFYFIGVTTKKSSIMKVFPLWMKELGRPEIVIEGVDLKIHDDPENYRQAVAQIKYDPNSLGALVTTHKMDLYAAARDMFEFLDPYAQICSELSSISKLDGRLEGHAKDPITAGLSLDAIIEPGYFGRTGGEVLLFGAGGSSLATVLHLMNKKDKADRPRRIIVINRTQPRLDHMKEMVNKLGTDIQIQYIASNDAKFNDGVMAAMPEQSIIINATGMGKDVPGSPITDEGLFPRNSIAWEFNYRGELDFMHQAEKQVQSRNVRVEDGWVYFLHGWSQVVAQVLHVDLTPELFQRLAVAAEIVHH